MQPTFEQGNTNKKWLKEASVDQKKKQYDMMCALTNLYTYGLDLLMNARLIGYSNFSFACMFLKGPICGNLKVTRIKLPSYIVKKNIAINIIIPNYIDILCQVKCKNKM